MPGFLWWDSAGLAVFVEVEITGAAIPQELAEFNSATEAHLYTREPSTALAIRCTNDCV